MKRIGDKPLTQAERNQRYREKNKLVLFSVRIGKDYVDALNRRLQAEGKTKTEFLKEVILKYLNTY